MKCKNCSGHYSSRELECPWCGTVNQRGLTWKRIRDKAQGDLTAAEAEMIPIRRRYVANIALSWIIGIEILLIILSLLVLLLLSPEGLNLLNRPNADTLSQLETLYEEKNFEEMSNILAKMKLHGLSKYQEYAQADLIHMAYQGFCEYRMHHFQNLGTQDHWYLDSLLASINRVLSGGTYVTPDMTDRNHELWQEYCQDAEIFARCVLGFNDEETELLGNGMLSPSDRTRLTDKILEGR